MRIQGFIFASQFERRADNNKVYAHDLSVSLLSSPATDELPPAGLPLTPRRRTEG